MKDARRPRGASMIVLTLIIALLIVFVVGLFAFELNRVEVARAQLRSGTEAAALAAVTTLASQQSTNITQAHNDSRAAALACFRRNEVLGTQMDGADPDEPGIPAAYLAAVNPDNPPVKKEGSLFIEFLDPNSVPPNAVVPLGDDRGKAIRCYGNFHYQPAFSAFVGVGDTFLRCMSTGGVPDLDVVLCFDISGSIDDQTNVTLVKRYMKWKNTPTQFTGEPVVNTFGSRCDPIPNTIDPLTGSPYTRGVRYYVCNDPDGANGFNASSGKAVGSIYGLMDPAPTGTSFNGVAPQGLGDQLGGGYTFNPTLRGLPNQGGLPPNDVTAGNDEQGLSTFTDEVVNLDGNIIFGNYTYDSSTPTTPGNPPGPPGVFTFSSIPVLVEASRGNLDNAVAFQNSGAQAAFNQLGIAVAPAAGFKAAYDAQAFAMLKPIGDAKRAASLFYTLMNNNTKGHFGLVTFTTGVGSSPSSTFGPRDSISMPSPDYTGDVSLNYPNPMVALNPSIAVTGYTTCINALPNLVACQSTNINQSLITARTQLTTNQRPTAKRAIVLFTDGQPTTGGDPRGGVCGQLASDGIPVYSIGLAQNTAIVPGEIDLLNDGGIGTNHTYTDPITGTPANYTATADGISKICSNGGKFYLVTNSANLGIIFGNIARSLCALVK